MVLKCNVGVIVFFGRLVRDNPQEPQPTEISAKSWEEESELVGEKQSKIQATMSAEVMLDNGHRLRRCSGVNCM